jgi:hypothetical protein
VNWEQKQG